MSERIWVEIETHKQTTGISMYRGSIDKADFEAILNETYTKKWVKLEWVFWNESEFVQDYFENDQHIEDRLVTLNTLLGEGPGQYEHHTGEMYVQADTIVVIYLLQDGSGRYKGNVVPLP